MITKTEIESYLDGTISEEARRRLVNEVRTDKDVDDWMRSQMESADEMMPARISERVWTTIENQINKKNEYTECRSRFSLLRWSIAACVCCLLMGATAWFGYKKAIHDAQPTAMTMQPLEIRTNIGEHGSAVLPDGTMVHLNAMSRVQYDCQMTDGCRRVVVEGEVYFDVAKDTEHPFIIHANQMDVTCLGTALNVRNYADEPTSSVVLVEGKVRVATEKGDLTMEPNSRVECDKQSLQMSKSNVLASNYTCWLQGETRYNNQTLADITRELSRNYHLNIIITNDELSQQRFTGYLGACSLRNVLDILTITSDMAYHIDGDSVYIYARNTKN